MKKRIFLPIAAIFSALLLLMTVHFTPSAKAQVLPPGFSDVTVFSGLTNPTAIRFAGDGRVFVAEKSGLIKVFDNLSDPTPTVVADLRTQVHNFWDRGLLGLALDPNFPTNPYIYVMYSHDASIGGPAPKWGSADTDSDPCPNPPGATSDGCVISSRISRIQLNGDVITGAEQVLVEDWCQQYPSHSVGSLAFGPDGALYASAGDGASFNFADYGQKGNPLNPCGDPPTGIGGTQAPPSAEGGALRAQDLQTAGDPVTLDGTVIRINPSTGDAMADNPLSGNSDPNARRIIAYGLRNPFRFTFKPGTNEIWLGDVGWDTWEEINRIQNPTASVKNFGWPCYEGNNKQSAYKGLGLSICDNLYASGSATPPFFTYKHNTPIVTGEDCTAGSSSISGVAFQFYPGGPYPSDYDGALFFADYSRKCIWAIKKGTNGLPDVAHIENFVTSAASPVELQLSPQGELYYPDFNGGGIHKIIYNGQGSPTPTPSPTPQPGNLPVVTISAPSPTFTWKVGDLISFSGSAKDSSGSAIPVSKLKWEAIMHHCPSDCHTHLLQTFNATGSGSFSAPDHEYPSYIELKLTAIDSSGNSGSTSVDINPKTVKLNFQTFPAGMALVDNSSSLTAPFSSTVIMGSANTVSGTSPQVIGGKTYKFSYWSDKQAQTHTITAPSTDSSFTANYYEVKANGLNATYFNNKDLTGNVVNTLDPQIGFNWAKGSPEPTIDPDTFSVRWTGFVVPTSTATYKFYTNTDDGVRLWVNNKLVIDKWVNQSAKEWSGTISLTQGQKYPIKMEYYDGTGNAVAQLSWSAPGVAKKIIPAVRFFPQ